MPKEPLFLNTTLVINNIRLIASQCVRCAFVLNFTSLVTIFMFVREAALYYHGIGIRLFTCLLLGHRYLRRTILSGCG